MNNVTRDDLLAMPFPLPPLTEQQAIVARVDSLMAMINELERQVTARKEQAQMLMLAVLREAFTGGEGAAEDLGGTESAPIEAAHASPASEALRKPRAGRASPLRRPRRPAHGNPLPLVAEAPPIYSGNIPQRILAHMQAGLDYSRAELLEATGISEVDWTWAVRQLKEEGKVRQTGERRGARYTKK